jgi:hypothetical protein
MWSRIIKMHYFVRFYQIRTFYGTIILLLCELLCGLNGYSLNDSKKLKNTIIFDSAKIEIREPPDYIQKELLNNSDYKYDHIGPAPKTLWERFKEWFWRKAGDIFNSKGGSIGFRILEYVLILTAIVLIIGLLLKNNLRALFYGKSASISIDFNEFEEDIHKINFNELITFALSEKDFRRAVRLHFLKLLKELSDKNLIIWKIDKTNNDYSIELSNTKYNNYFNELAISYEYIWYGNFQLDEQNFKTTIEKFKLFTI